MQKQKCMKHFIYSISNEYSANIFFGGGILKFIFI